MLQSRNITGVEVDPAYVYITTDKEVVQYNRLTQFIRFFSVVDNLPRQEGSLGTVLNGTQWTVMFTDGDCAGVRRERRSLRGTQARAHREQREQDHGPRLRPVERADAVRLQESISGIRNATTRGTPIFPLATASPRIAT
jgi:hypothetical protein